MEANMETTVDYPTRADLIAALLEARKQGVHVDVVGNGRTLRFPAGYGGADAPETAASAPGVPQAPPTAATPVETPPAALEPEVAAFVGENTVEAVLEAVEAGLFTAEQAVLAEQNGRQRKGILALANNTQEEEED